MTRTLKLVITDVDQIDLTPDSSVRKKVMVTLERQVRDECDRVRANYAMNRSQFINAGLRFFLHKLRVGDVPSIPLSPFDGNEPRGDHRSGFMVKVNCHKNGLKGVVSLT